MSSIKESKFLILFLAKYIGGAGALQTLHGALRFEETLGYGLKSIPIQEKEIKVRFKHVLKQVH